MEPSRFDELTKALATSTSRRQALKALAATLGGLLGLGSVGTALANCKPNGIGCNTGTQCCSGKCQHGTCCSSQEGATCSVDRDCCSGTCCQGVCCTSGQVCLSNGSCATPCPAFGGPCSGSCGSGICTLDISDAQYCSNGTFLPGSFCAYDSMCPKGYFCQPDATACIAVC